MPPRMPQRRPARSRGYDPTVSIATAASVKALNTNDQNQSQQTKDQSQKDNFQKQQNDDLKKLIETLKNKIGTNPTPPQKKVPPPPGAKWERSVNKEHTWTPKPAYTILTRVSNHETVPARATKQAELTINALPHSFLYKPGADGMKIDKVTVKSGRQVCWG